MQLKNILLKIKIYLSNYLLAQLVVTLVSTPILIYWGLPISKMSFIGNLIFLPILIIFLILSSIIFFTEILNIPNSLFIYLLNKTDYLWKILLHTGQKSWLLGFGKINFLFLLLIPIAVFLMLNHKKLDNINKKIIGLTLLLIISFTSLKLISNKYSINKISFEDKLFVSKNSTNQIKIKDLGLLSKKQSPDKFIEYTLKQEILKNFGTLNIKSFSSNKIGIRIFKSIITISEIFNIKKIKLVVFNKQLTKYGWKTFFEMKNNLEKNNIKLIRTKS